MIYQTLAAKGLKKIFVLKMCLNFLFHETDKSIDVNIEGDLLEAKNLFNADDVDADETGLYIQIIRAVHNFVQLSESI